VWFADGAELGVNEGGRVRETTGARVSPAARISGSPSGDVWTLTGGTLARFAVLGDGGPDWDASVAPVFRRACESCHRVGGEAGVALGTKEAWAKRRDKIRKRVLVERTMPPPGRALSEADREAIRAWIDR
jgi:mono/diheme cytochrome c family protein